MPEPADDTLVRPAVTVDALHDDTTDSPLLTRTFVLAWVVNFLQFVVFYVLITTMALYAIRQFAASDAAAGFASSAFIVGATVARLASGYLVDALGRRRMLLAALALGVVACALYVPAGSLPLLVAVRLVHGFGYAFVSTATMTIAQAGIPAARRAEGTGYFALGPTLASALGPALALLVVGRAGYDLLLWATVGTSALALLLGLLLHDTGAAPDAPRTRPTLHDLVHPAVVPIGAFMLLAGLCYAGVLSYLNPYAEERGVVAGAGLFFVAYATTMLSMRFVLGRVQDRRGDNLVVRIGLVCFALALALLAVADADWHVVAAGALTGLGWGTLMPAAQAIAVRAVPAHQLGTGISTLLLLTDAGVGLGPVALGYLVSATGYGTMYAVLAGVVVLAGAVYRVAHGRHEGARRAAAA